MNPDEIVDALLDRDVLTAEAKAVIARTVRSELEPLIRSICREELSALLKKLRERMRGKKTGGLVEQAAPPLLDGGVLVNREQADKMAADPAIVNNAPPDYRPPIEPLPTFEDVKGILKDPDPAPGTRTCRCCGDSYERTGNRQLHCGPCSTFNLRIKRNQAIVHALWTDYPEIAERVVTKLKEAGKWPA